MGALSECWSLRKCDDYILFVTSLERHIAGFFREGSHRHRSMTRHTWLNMGYEIIKPGMPYDWDGLRRGGNRNQVIWLFQFSLRGWGWLETKNRRKKIQAGHAFSVKIPSQHRYYADPACEEWSFFWLMVKHPYAVERILSIPAFDNRVLRFGEDAVAPLSTIRQLLEAKRATGVADAYRAEVQLLSVVYELERWAFLAQHPMSKRDTFLDSIRDQNSPAHSVENLAQQFGMSRTHFSHHFRRMTGESPAAHLRKERLKQAENLLATTTLSVKEIADKAGFASSNQFCKSFRAHYQTSPGNYRRMFPSSSMIERLRQNAGDSKGAKFSREDLHRY